MKKVIYLLALIAAPVLASAQDTDKDKEAAKTKMIAECMNDLKEQTTTDELKVVFQDFCTCQTENMLKQFSLKEIDEISNAKDAEPAKQQEIQAKVMPVIMPCVEELQKKMGAGGVK